MFEWQIMHTVMDVYSDATWASCHTTRKSTSGGMAMLETHALKTWSNTLSVIAKSSAESELYAIVRASTEALGLLTLFKDVHMAAVDSRVHVDASAAKSIVER